MEPGEFRGPERFQLIRQLGAGGMGIVYEALDRETNTRVALKTIRSPAPELLLYLKREFREAQALQHPNLLSLGELIEEGGVWFFTMELVRGVNFLDYVRVPTTGSPGQAAEVCGGGGQPSPPGVEGACAAGDAVPGFDEGRLRDALAQLTRGLSAIHEAGKVHRDVKPSNILVTHEGHVLLADFGLVTDTVPASGGTESVATGTVAYMAPEQAAGQRVGPAADWYAVGAVLYQALVGQPPFVGPPLKVLIDKQSLQPAAPRRLVPMVPEDLDQLCLELLQVDPSARPDGHAILRVLGQATPETQAGAATASSWYGPTAPFVGRGAEVAFLRQAFADSQSRRAVTVLVHGESGVGKSALVGRFTDLLVAEAQGLVVLAGRCYERESVPFKAFDGVIDALSGFMQRLPKAEAAALVPSRASLLLQAFPVLGRVDVLAGAPRHEIPDPQELRTRAFAACRELLGLLARRRGLVITIDDLQWGDADSVALAAEILRPPEPPPLLLLGTWREVGEDGTRVRARLALLPGDVRQLELDRLPPADARELAIRLVAQAIRVRGESEVSAEAIARESAGHPLFIDALVRHAALGSRKIGSVHGTSLRLEDALSARIAHLDDISRRVLELVAVAGAPLDLETAARAAGVSLGELGRHAGRLRVANLARSSGARGSDTIEAYHDRVRGAVWERLGPAERDARHRELAQALEASGHGDPEGLAIHYQAAGDRRKAAGYAVEAADQAFRALAFGRAAALYRLALDLGRGSDLDARALRGRLGASLANAGRGTEAAEAYLAAAMGAETAEALDLKRRAAEQYVVTGHIDEGLEAFRSVLAAHGLWYPSTPLRALALHLLRRAQLLLRGTRFRERDRTQVAAAELARIDVCWHAGLGLGMADNIRGAAFQATGLLLALRAGEPYRISRALALEAVYRFSAGSSAAAESLLRVAEQLAHRLDDPHAVALIEGIRGFAAYVTGRFRAARDRFLAAEVLLRERCVAVHWEMATTQLWLSRTLIYLGELAALADRLPALLRECRDRGDLYGATSLQLGAAPFLCLAADQQGRARAEVLEGLAQWSPRGFHLQHYYALFAESSADLYEGAGSRAIERVQRAWSPLSRSFLLRIQIVRIQSIDLRARAALLAARAQGSETGRLLAMAEQDGRRLAREGLPWAEALATLVRAGVASARSDPIGARRLLEDAARRFDEVEMALHAAVARRRGGGLLGGDEGRALVEAADAWMLAQRIRNPARMSAMLAPGFPD